MKKVYNLSVLYFIAAVIGFFMSFDDVEAGFLTLGISLALAIINFVAVYCALKFADIARDKGYDYKSTFWFCYFFSFIGFIYVCALPDRGVNGTFSSQNNGTNEIGSAKAASESKGKKTAKELDNLPEI